MPQDALSPTWLNSSGVRGFYTGADATLRTITGRVPRSKSWVPSQETGSGRTLYKQTESCPCGIGATRVSVGTFLPFFQSTGFSCVGVTAESAVRPNAVSHRLLSWANRQQTAPSNAMQLTKCGWGTGDRRYDLPFPHMDSTSVDEEFWSRSKIRRYIPHQANRSSRQR